MFTVDDWILPLEDGSLDRLSFLSAISFGGNNFESSLLRTLSTFGPTIVEVILDLFKPATNLSFPALASLSDTSYKSRKIVSSSQTGSGNKDSKSHIFTLPLCFRSPSYFSWRFFFMLYSSTSETLLGLFRSYFLLFLFSPSGMFSKFGMIGDGALFISDVLSSPSIPSLDDDDDDDDVVVERSLDDAFSMPSGDIITISMLLHFVSCLYIRNRVDKVLEPRENSFAFGCPPHLLFVIMDLRMGFVKENARVALNTSKMFTRDNTHNIKL
mmetsp:Transcript_4111/g.7883  ORF Transcript_4111/g.7883 Transcript_4111/m.7883 type:complete len:270 (-) Transcript_4111:429-1238(-)